jgi:hypothetical protein
MDVHLRPLALLCLLAAFDPGRAVAASPAEPFPDADPFGEWAPIPAASYLQWLLREEPTSSWRDRNSAPGNPAAESAVQTVSLPDASSSGSASLLLNEPLSVSDWSSQIEPAATTSEYAAPAADIKIRPADLSRSTPGWRATGGGKPVGRVRLSSFEEPSGIVDLAPVPPSASLPSSEDAAPADRDPNLAPFAMNSADAVSSTPLAPAVLTQSHPSPARVQPIPVTFPASPSGSWQLFSEDTFAAISPVQPLAAFDVAEPAEPDFAPPPGRLPPPAPGEGQYLPPEAPLEMDPVPQQLPEARQSHLADSYAALNKPLGAIGLTRGLGGPSPENLAAVIDPALEPIVLWGTPWACPRPTRYSMCFCHRPLYFEDPNLERCGLHAGCCQSLISATQFFGSIVLLPAKMAVHCPDELVHTLGDCPTCCAFGWEDCFR